MSVATQSDCRHPANEHAERHEHEPKDDPDHDQRTQIERHCTNHMFQAGTRTSPNPISGSTHVALVADEDRFHTWLLMYEIKCAEIGVRLIRVFRLRADAERWLAVMSATRNLF